MDSTGVHFVGLVLFRLLHFSFQVFHPEKLKIIQEASLLGLIFVLRTSNFRGQLSADPAGNFQYVSCTGICRCGGSGFQAVWSGIGYKNQNVLVKSRVSLAGKLISGKKS